MAQLQVHKVFGALPGTPVDNSLYFVKTLSDELRIYVTESSGNIAREIVVGGQVDSIQAGDNVTIDATDPTSPIVSFSGSSSTVELEVTQASHGFSVGEVLKAGSVAGSYELAQANSVANAEVVGIVSEVIDVNTYKIQTNGFLSSGVPAGSQGDVVFLSPTTPGGMTTTKPSTNGQVIKSLGVLVDDPLVLKIFDHIGILIDDGVTPPVSRDKSFTIESPTSTEDIGLWRTNVDITITGIHAVSLGTTPSLTYTLRFNSDRSAVGTEVVTGGSTTTSTTTGDSITVFDDATIPAGSWIWLETTAQSGTTDQVTITINYDE